MHNNLVYQLQNHYDIDINLIIIMEGLIFHNFIYY